MNEDSVFDFETEIMDHYAASTEEELFYDDYAQGAVDAESYDP